MRFRSMVALALCFACSLSLAQEEVDKAGPPAGGGGVEIRSDFGTVTVAGWDGAEVVLQGTLAAGYQELKWDRSHRKVRIEVRTPSAWRNGEDDTEYRSNIVVYVPKDSKEIEVRTLNASVEVMDVLAELDIETVNGSVSITGTPRSLHIESLTGTVETNATTKETVVTSAMGPVFLRGSKREVYVHTATGEINVVGMDLRDVELRSTAGNIYLEGNFDERGDVDIETFSGSVELLSARDVNARFQGRTVGGEITGDLGPRPRTHGSFNPVKDFDFRTGRGDFEIEIETFDGDITMNLMEHGPTKVNPEQSRTSPLGATKRKQRERPPTTGGIR